MLKENSMNQKKYDIPFFIKMIIILQNISIFFSDIFNAIGGIQIACVLFYVIHLIISNDKIIIRKFILFWCFYLIIMIFNILVGGDTNFIIFFLICNFLMIMELNVLNIGVYELKIMKICSWIHLIASLGVYLLPQSMMNSILSFFINSDYNANYSWRCISNVNVGMTTQPGMNAIFLTVLFVIYAVQAINTKNKRTRNIIIMLVSFLMILTTSKRSALIISIFSISIFYFSKNRSMKLKINYRNILKYTLGIIFIIAFFYYMYNKTTVFDTLINKISNLSSNSDISNGRFDLWNSAFELFIKSPVYGIGLKRFYFLTGLDVHNTYIQILAETGIIGFTFFVSGLFSIFYNSIRSLQRVYMSIDNHILKNVSGTGYTLLIFFIVYGFIGNTFIDYMPIMMVCMSNIMINGRKKIEK